MTDPEPTRPTDAPADLTGPTRPTGAGTSSGTGAAPLDPVLAKRARVKRLVSIGQRLGYSLLGVFCVLVLAGFPLGFPPALTTAAIAAILVGSIVLAPAIVFGYGVKAADREDREGDWR